VALVCQTCGLAFSDYPLIDGKRRHLHGGGNVLSACHSSLGEALDSTPLARHERWPVNNAGANSPQSKSLTENCDRSTDEGSV
jgi:hypothetical protein